MDKSLKIMQVCLSPYFGGMEKFCGDLADGLSKYCDISVLVKKNSLMEHYIKKHNLNYHSLQFINYIDLPAIYKIRRLIKKQNVDIVHHHGSSEMGLLTPALWNMPSVKLINHKNLYISSNKTDLYHRLIYSRADAIIAVSEGVKNNILDHYPVSKEKVYVFPNAINTRKYLKTSFKKILSGYVPSSYKNAYFLTTVSRLVPGKGLERVLETVSNVFDVSNKMVLFIVGKGRDDYVKHLKKLIPDRHRNRVFFTGFQKDIYSILKETDLFLSFSKGESFGFSVLEAMIAGVPILATRVSGHKLLLKNHPECLIDSDETTSQYVSRIFQCLDEMGGHKQYDYKQFTYDQLIPELLDFYHDL